ncbi:MAG: lipopolysaccharide transport periplasmic protein LptA [Alphaproteobacteria bacterium]
MIGTAAMMMAAPSLGASPATPKIGNSKAPIEINADNLQVFQEDNKAIFTGKVVAIQDKVRLKSDRMTVFYRSPDEKSQQQADAIRSIDVEGNVFLTTPEETASGDQGTYSVEKEQIELRHNVILTRGKNTLKGDQLTYDMKKGKSVMSATADASGKKQRVRALFIPDEAKKKEQ